MPSNEIRRDISPNADRALCQRDALEGADDVVGAFFGKETFVITGTEIPLRAFVVIVAVKSPDAVHHDETTDTVVPIIANIMKTQVRAREGPLKTGVIVKYQFRQTYCFCDGRYRVFSSRRSVITQRTELPFHVDDAAVVGR